MPIRFRTLLALGAISCAVVDLAPAAAQDGVLAAAQAEAPATAQDEAAAAAQDTVPRPRVTLHLNGAFHAPPPGFEAFATERAYGEEASFHTVHTLEGGGSADAGVLLHVDERFAVGGAFSWMRVSDTASFTGAVPHPLDLERPREPPPQAFDLRREERAFHLSAAWRIPLGQRAELTLSGGPTAVNVSQDTVVGLSFQEGAPPDFDQIGLEAETGKQRRNAIGGHVALDFVFMATRHIGFGYFVRFARATVDLPRRGEASVTANAGSVQTGAGLRVRF